MPGRALDVFRQEGVAGVRLRALDATVYRRLLITARGLRSEDSPVEEIKAAGLEVSFLEPRELEAYAAFRPDAAPSETRRRFDAGHRCVVARRGGRIVHGRWISPEQLESPYLGLSFDLPATSVYVHDTFTAAEARRQRISLMVSTWYRGALRDEGVRTVLGSTWPGNAPAMAMLRANDQDLIGAIGTIRLGPARIPLRRGMRPGYIGSAHRFAPETR